VPPSLAQKHPRKVRSRHRWAWVESVDPKPIHKHLQFPEMALLEAAWDVLLVASAAATVVTELKRTTTEVPSRALNWTNPRSADCRTFS